MAEEEPVSSEAVGGGRGRGGVGGGVGKGGKGSVTKIT